MKSSYILDVGGLALDEQNGVETSWVHALPIGDYKHPKYGTISVTAERAKRFAENIKNKVRGTVDPSINYVHNNENEAAGWVKNAEDRTDGLWLFVEWVKDAAQAIKDKKWRYFSSEFEDEWEDPQGNKHKDVILGGALTNRPFMKDLVPVNLSEETYTLAFDLISAVTGKDPETLKGGNMPLSEDDLKKIVEGVATKLSESKVTDPATKKLTDIPELKELAETNPLVKFLMDHVETQNSTLKTNAQSLKEAEIAHKLSEFDRSKIVLTPVARQRVQALMLELDETQNEALWSILTEMKRGSSFLVELGERAGATVNYGSPKSAKKQLDELTAEIKKARSLSDVDALEAACAENPALYARYRQEMMEGADN